MTDRNPYDPLGDMARGYGTQSKRAMRKALSYPEGPTRDIFRAKATALQKASLQLFQAYEAHTNDWTRSKDGNDPISTKSNLGRGQRDGV